MKSRSRALLFTALTCAAAHAQPEAPTATVSLRARGCDALDLERLTELLALELGVPIRQGAEPGPNGALQLQCEEPVARLEARQGEGAVAVRSVDLTRVPAAGRPRLLALSLAELWDAAERPPPQPSPAPPDTASAPEPPPWRLWIFGAVRAGFAGTAPTFGGGLALQRDLPFRLGVSADLWVEGAWRDVSLGAVHALLVSSAALAWLRGELGPLRAEGGVGARVGIARFFGDPLSREDASGGVLQAAWAAPVVGGRLSLAQRGGRWLFAMDLETGLVTRPLRGTVDGTPVLALEGAYVAVRLGAGLRF